MSKIINSKLSKVKIAAMMLLILLASIWFALNSQPQQAMKRESRFVPVAPDLIIMAGDIFPAFTDSILVNLPNGQTLVWEVA